MLAMQMVELLEILRSTNMPSGQIAYIRQRQARGLGHAVWCARRLIAPNESFAVILPDDVVIPSFLMGSSRRIHAAVFSFIAGVMPPMPMLGRSLL